VLIALMILGVGMIMIAGAFPVALRFHSESVDRTVAGLLARTAVSRLTLFRTRNGQTEFHERDSGYRDFWPQVSVAECFQTPSSGSSTQVIYLFEGSGSNPTHKGGILREAGLGDDIDEWLPPQERVAEGNDRFGYHLFYRLIADPGGGNLKRTYVAYAVVQRTPESAVGGSFDERFPPPSSPLSLNSASGQKIRLSGSYRVRPGARLVDCSTGDWYEVVAVDGSELELDRGVSSSMRSHKIRVVNYAVAVFAGIVSKQFVAGQDDDGDEDSGADDPRGR
jgi:hypothetical protein